MTPYENEVFGSLLPLIEKYQIPYFILGRGCNLIVSDQGFRGAAIYTAHLNNYEIHDTEIRAETGLKISTLADKAAEHGLSGLEFGGGIPGTLGGALYMNAGAYGGEIKDIVKEAFVYNPQGEKIHLSREELQLDYRHSIFHKKDYLATEVFIELKKGNEKQIKEKIKELNRRRREKQPLSWPSAGSIFKRPPGHYAGKLIDDCGLKGMRVGDAQISEKHAGFMINLGQATARDIVKLIEKTQKEIYKQKGVKLEVEPRFIGEF